MGSIVYRVQCRHVPVGITLHSVGNRSPEPPIPCLDETRDPQAVPFAISAPLIVYGKLPAM